MEKYARNAYPRTKAISQKKEGKIMEGVSITLEKDVILVKSPSVNISFERMDKSIQTHLFGADLSRTFAAINALHDLNLPLFPGNGDQMTGETESVGARRR